MMKRSMVASLVAAVILAGFAGSAFADDKADAQAALKKIGNSNYSWTTTVENVSGAGGGRGFGRGPAAGKASAEYVTFTLTMQNSSTDIVIKGDKGAAKMESGWMNKAELQKAADDAGGFSPELIVLGTINNFKSPVTQAAEILDKASSVKKTADGYSAEINPDSAKTLLTPNFGRGGAGGAAPQITVAGPKGTLTITTKDGAASKIAIHLEGTVTSARGENAVNRTTTMEIKDVGTTKQDVPADAAKKLQ